MLYLDYCCSWIVLLWCQKEKQTASTCQSHCLQIMLPSYWSSTKGIVSQAMELFWNYNFKLFFASLVFLPPPSLWVPFQLFLSLFLVAFCTYLSLLVDAQHHFKAPITFWKLSHQNQLLLWLHHTLVPIWSVPDLYKVEFWNLRALKRVAFWNVSNFELQFHFTFSSIHHGELLSTKHIPPFVAIDVFSEFLAFPAVLFPFYLWVLSPQLPLLSFFPSLNSVSWHSLTIFCFTSHGFS